MKSLSRLRLILLALAIVLVGCVCFSHQSSSTGSRRIRLASFNIQVFGRKKASDSDVMDTLAKILRRYDIVVVMEIRDSSGEAFPQLVRHTNKGLGNDPFFYTISERTGRTVSKEQYAVMYRQSAAVVLSDLTVSDLGDHFQREPYIVMLALKRPAAAAARDIVPLVLLCLHTDPDEAVEELEALYNVVQSLKDDNLLIAGDLNADCSYVNKGEMSRLSLRHDPSFHWLIGDEVDTTVKSSNCAYDRMIASNSTLRMVSSAEVFRFDLEYGLSASEAAKVSDHYPVELDIVL